LRTALGALGALEAQENPPPPDRCQAVTQAVLWIDVALGLDETQWPERKRFLDLLARRFPVIQPVAGELAAELKKENLTMKPDHQRALQTVFTRLKQMAMTLPK
jgi:hypothetical protein